LSEPSRPVNVSFVGYLLLSAPSPHVCERPDRLRVLWADLTPRQSSAPLLLLAATYLLPLNQEPPSSRRFSPRIPRSWSTPADPRSAHQNTPSVLASGPLTPSPSALSSLTGLFQASGSAVSLAVYVVPCVRFNCFRSAILLPPRQLQHSVWVVG